MRNVRICLAPVVAAVLCCLIPGNMLAWNSLFYYTHEALTDHAISGYGGSVFISAAEYPDIHRFAEEL